MTVGICGGFTTVSTFSKEAFVAAGYYLGGLLFTLSFVTAPELSKSRKDRIISIMSQKLKGDLEFN